jgi:hypothetical protein
LTVEGELSAAEAERGWAEITAAAAGLIGAAPLRLDLTHLDLPSGVSVAAGITALRALLHDHGELTLIGAPQMLAHTLYKIGSLGAAGLRLEDVREDEPTTAN